MRIVRAKAPGGLFVWLILATALCIVIVSWAAHRRGQMAEETRVEDARRNREVAKWALVSAASNGDTVRVSQMLKEGEYPADLPQQLLINASNQGKVSVARVLLDHGCNPDGKKGDGGLLMSAVSYGHIGVVDLLLRRGADVNVGPAEDWSALTYAVMSNQVQIAKRLLDAGAKVDHQTTMILPPRTYPRKRRPVDLETVPSYVGGGGFGSGMSPKKLPPRKLVSPLMLAAWLDRPEMVSLLLKHKPNLRLKAREGETALDLARKAGNHEIVSMLSRASIQRQ